MNLHLTTLNPRHAAAAARLHIDGQPGTFLSSLGEEVLTVLYQEISQSDAGFGYAVIDNDGRLLAFASATPSVGRLFLDIGLRRSGSMVLPLMRRFLSEPRLLLLSGQTLLYPLRQSSSTRGDGAELLSIMTEADMRSQGLGAALLSEIFARCRQKGIDEIEVTVDSENLAAARFYIRHGFKAIERFTLYGRSMTRFCKALDVSPSRVDL